jgi:predicted ATP-dependent serine protease
VQKLDAVVIDSIQTVFAHPTRGRARNVGQARECRS